MMQRFWFDSTSVDNFTDNFCSAFSQFFNHALWQQLMDGDCVTTMVTLMVDVTAGMMHISAIVQKDGGEVHAARKVK